MYVIYKEKSTTDWSLITGTCISSAYTIVVDENAPTVLTGGRYEGKSSEKECQKNYHDSEFVQYIS